MILGQTRTQIVAVAARLTGYWHILEARRR